MRLRLLAAFVVVLAVAGCTSYTGGTDDTGAGDVTPQSGTVQVNVTDAGFSPARVVVTAGTTVRWVNQQDVAVWPASDVHPVHQSYPADYSEAGSYGGSQACSGQGQQKDGAFDPCRRVPPGGSFSFTFGETGTWGYHDHLAPSRTGTVVVR